MTAYLADAALIDGEIKQDVRLDIVDGRIMSVGMGEGTRIAGLVVPGMANLHSHAFQRAMAGLAERAGTTGENFWGWREVMYRFLARLTPDDVEAIAAQLYVECLVHGYTAVGEFHYLHNAPDGRAYDDPAELSLRIAAAAGAAGIGLTLLPVLYCRAGFGGAPAAEGQKRFALSVDDYAGLCHRMRALVPTGVAPHSLRAVTPDELAAALALAGSLGSDTPIHIHIAEQTREVEDCIGWSGQRPVAWLLDHAPVDMRWCLVHATHVDAQETAGMAATGAVVGLCPSTEANLGDGIFPFADFVGRGGRFGIGTDSNVSTSPVEELRWLDYVNRLVVRGRNASATQPGASIGTAMLNRAGAGGAQALARGAGTIAPGEAADLVVLDTEHPALLGRHGTQLADSWVFSGNANPVRHVMVRGRWVVRDGEHEQAAKIGAAFARCIRSLADNM